jgi:uncharacterized membrane protein
MNMHKKNIIAFISIISIAAVTISGCYYDKGDLLYHLAATNDCSTVNAKFSADVAPLMLSKCATSGCHDAGTAAGGTVLETYTQIATKAARIKQRCIVEKTMPSGTPLSATEIAALTCWISSGTPNN